MPTPESIELIARMEQLISNPNIKHNPYFPNREQWIKSQEAKIKEIKQSENVNKNYTSRN